MSQQLSNPPEQDRGSIHCTQPQGTQPPDRRARFSMTSIVLLLALVSILILSSSILLVVSAVQGVNPQVAHVATSTSSTPARNSTRSAQTPASTPSVTGGTSLTPTVTPPIFAPNNVALPPLQLPPDHYVIYEQQNNIYLLSSMGGTPQVITTPGYVYSQAVRPILTPNGQLLYSGDGIWLTDIFGSTAHSGNDAVPTHIADVPTNQVLTSLVLSSDGTTIAWSTEPASGNGVIDIFAGPLTAPTKVYEQPSTTCPCYRVFAFMNGNGKQSDTTLLLTDGQQSHGAVQFGLWSFDLTNALSATPEQLMDVSTQQGPLALEPFGNMLLYSSYEGEVPIPSDNSVPSDIAVLKYPNSLDVTTLDGQPLHLDSSQVVLPEQHQLANTAAYHWVTTPVFTPDGHTLIYVEFSSQGQAPFDRSSALFAVHTSGSGKNLRVSKPQLLATSSTTLLELGAWFNNRILTFYGDDSLYALDVQSGEVTTIVQTGVYARIVAVVGMGGA